MTSSLIPNFKSAALYDRHHLQTKRGLAEQPKERLRIHILRAEFHDCTWYFASLVSWNTPEINLTQKTIIYNAHKFANSLNLSVSFQLSIVSITASLTDFLHFCPSLPFQLSFTSFLLISCCFQFPFPCFCFLLSTYICIFAHILFN